MRRFRASGLAILAAGAMFGAGVTAQAQGLPFLRGDLVVSRVGNGSAALTNAATSVFLDEYTTTGTLVQTIALPAAAAGANNPFTNSGTATSEGFVTLSGNGQYLTMGGYAAAAGTANIAASASTAAPRVVARVDALGNVNTTTSLSDAYSGGNIRAAVTTDGTAIYTGGVTAFPTGGPATSGVRQTTTGSTTSSSFAGNPANVRVVNIFGGQVYASTGGSTAAANTYTAGIYALGGSATTPVVAMAGASPYDFVFTNANTVFVADDRTTVSNGMSPGGLLEYTNTGSGFALAQTFNLSGATAGTFAGLRGLTATSDGSTLYAVSTDNRIVSFNTASSVFTTLVTGTTNTAFRGLDFAPSGAAPVPEAGTVLSLSMGLAVLGGAGLRSRRTRKTATANAPAQN